MRGLKLSTLKEELAVVRLEPSERALAACVAAVCLEQDGFFVLGRTAEEISLVVQGADGCEPACLATARERCGDASAANAEAKVEGGWRALKVEGPLEFGMVGVLSKLLAPLADNAVPVFVVSTFDTDYIMVKRNKLEQTVAALVSSGYVVDGAAAAAEPAATLTKPRLEIRQFELERYFAQYEFSAPHLLCCSDCESLSMEQLLDMADEECKAIWANLSLGYTESGGLPKLRQGIANHYAAAAKSGDWVPAPENAIVLCPEEGIFLMAHALLRPGDHVVVPSLCYQSLFEVARSIGCELSRWEPRMDADGRWVFDVASLQEVVTDATRLVVTNFPHNPTGATVSTDEWAQLVAICKASNAYLFSDEMYRGLEFDAAARLAPAVLAYDRGISLCGVSKSLSCPGLRIGWLAARDTAFLSRVQALKDYTTICPPAPSEVLALIALRNADAIVARNLEITRNGLRAAVAFFARHADKFDFAPPPAGTICFPRVRSDGPLLRRWASSAEFCKALVDQAGIMLLPSSVYLLEEDPNCVRLGFGRRNVPDVFDRLEAWLDGALAA